MSYVRSFKKTLKDGTVQTYYGRVESYREGGKVHQRMVEYLGTHPRRRIFALEPPLARTIAPVLAEPFSPTDMMNALRDRGVPIDFRPRQVSLLNTPPLRRLALRVE